MHLLVLAFQADLDRAQAAFVEAFSPTWCDQRPIGYQVDLEPQLNGVTHHLLEIVSEQGFPSGKGEERYLGFFLENADDLFYLCQAQFPAGRVHGIGVRRARHRARCPGAVRITEETGIVTTIGDGQLAQDG